MPEQSRLLTIPEAADHLRLTPGSLYTQRARGEKPGALGFKIGKRVVFDPAEIQAYLDELKKTRDFENQPYPVAR